MVTIKEIMEMKIKPSENHCNNCDSWNGKCTLGWDDVMECTEKEKKE